MAALRPLLLLTAAALAAGCALRGEGGGLDLGAIARVSEEEERSVGAQVDQAIRAQLPLIDDPIVLGFANDLGQRIVATIEPQPFVYRFRVIPASTLNAFALPGGYIYLHSATVLEAGSLDELAGVLGHEIAHVKARHYARGSEQTFWPSLLARAAGIAAAVATGEGGLVAAAEGANVALQLKYTREFEREADELGSVFMARAGFQPAGMARFFERIVAAELPGGIHLPPYLYSHPDVDQRIDAVKQRAGSLRVTAESGSDLEAAFRDAQVRLELLVASGRTSLLGARPYDRALTDPLLAEADAAARAGEVDAAIERLLAAEGAEPSDPRVPFRLGELLEARGRTRDAIAAWRRAVALDPSVALAFFRLGNAYQALGERHEAAYYFEQAERRFAAGGAFQRRAQLALQTLSYPPVVAAGLADGREAEGAETVAGAAREEFAAGDAEAVWWARLDPHYAPLRERVRVRWIDPAGARVQEGAAEPGPKAHVVARLSLGGELRERFGRWHVEATLEGQVIDRRSFLYSSSLRRASSAQLPSGRSPR